MVKTLILTLGYSNTDFTRQYKIAHDGIGSASECETAIQALNAGISAGTENAFAEFFRSDDYDATDSNNIVGKCTGIVAAQLKFTTETEIPLKG